jgi:hypothetical protein
MTIHFNIPFTKKIFAQKFQTLKFYVCAQIEAIYIKFQRKNKFDLVSHTFGLKLNLKKCHIFEYIRSNEQLSLGVPIKYPKSKRKLILNTLYNHLLRSLILGTFAQTIFSK